MFSSPRTYLFQPKKSSFLTFILLFLLSIFLFVILSNPVFAASLQKPKTVSPKGKGTEAHPVFVWNVVNGATEYRLWIKSAGVLLFDQKLSATEAGCVAGGSCFFQPVISLTPEKNANWKVRALNSTEQSRWSSIRRYTLKGPKAPKTRTPRNTINVSEATYVWRAVSEAVSYELMVRQGGNELFAGTVQAADADCEVVGGDCHYNPALALGNGNYKWRVRAISAQGVVGKWSDFRAFRVRDVVVTENQAPVADDQSVSVDEDGNVAIVLSASDAEGDTLTYAVVLKPSNGSLMGTAPNLTYAPDADFNGEDSFAFIANDDELDSAVATVSITVSPVPEQPQNVSAEAGNAQVILSWTAVTDADNYAICVAEATIVDPINCTGGTPLVASGGGADSLLVDNNLVNGTEYFFVVLAVANVDGSPVYSVASAEVTATPQDTVQPTPTGRLNDTGIIACGDYAFDSGSGNHNNNVSCSQTVDADGDPIPAGQDGYFGRDVSDNDSSNGHAGFDFTKISANGLALPASAIEWSCVKDNVTGLIWENKTDDGGLHDKDDWFTWYSTDSASNGGSVGFAKPSDDNVNASDAICSGHDASDVVGTTWCNTTAFVNRVNAAGLCGGNNWRLPNREELRSLVSYDRFAPAIDDDYFPNTISSWHWSSSTYAPTGSGAWAVNFIFGNDVVDGKDLYRSVRLVRSGQ